MGRQRGRDKQDQQKCKGKRDKEETEIQLKTVGREKRKDREKREKTSADTIYEALRQTGRCQCVGYRKLKGEKMKMRGKDKT